MLFVYKFFRYWKQAAFWIKILLLSYSSCFLRELRKTGGRVLITLGDQDIDLSPTFTIFLSTRDPTVEFPPDICSRNHFVLICHIDFLKIVFRWIYSKYEKILYLICNKNRIIFLYLCKISLLSAIIQFAKHKTDLKITGWPLLTLQLPDPACRHSVLIKFWRPRGQISTRSDLICWNYRYN